MKQGTIFQSNRSQAIRLPIAAAFPKNVKRVDVVVIGRTRIITPAGESWESWFDNPAASADFMTDREQPTKVLPYSLSAALLLSQPFFWRYMAEHRLFWQYSGSRI